MSWCYPSHLTLFQSFNAMLTCPCERVAVIEDTSLSQVWSVVAVWSHHTWCLKDLLIEEGHLGLLGCFLLVAAAFKLEWIGWDGSLNWLRYLAYCRPICLTVKVCWELHTSTHNILSIQSHSSWSLIISSTCISWAPSANDLTASTQWLKEWVGCCEKCGDRTITS